MKIALTADAHLRRRQETPERYAALENIFAQCSKKGINVIFILGDLFDRDYNNFSDFDELCRKYPSLNITVLPGNHDPQIRQKCFTANNIRVIEQPEITGLKGLNVSFFFVPYQPIATMDEVIAAFKEREEFKGKWFLFGHGDYISGLRTANPYEDGIYMPLSFQTVLKYNPSKVFLGHIHQPNPYLISRIYYPGSPCGLDINETGKRRFLIFDPEEDSLISEYVETGVIYFNETLLVLPLEDEAGFIRKKLQAMVKKWNLSSQDWQKVYLRLKVDGYTKDRQSVFNLINEEMVKLGINFYDKEGADFSCLKMIQDESDVKILLLKKFQEKLNQIDFTKFEASSEDVLEEALEIIFPDREL